MDENHCWQTAEADARYCLQEVAAGHWSVRADEAIMRRMVESHRP